MRIVLGAVIVGFFLHGALHLEAATIALFGAALLMLYARSDVHEVLREVEWPTLLFFVGLFVLVGGLEVTGFIGRIAELLIGVGGSPALTAMLVMWGSAIASGIVDNIPFTATMIPVIQELAQAEGLSEAEVRPLWWALAIGAGVGRVCSLEDLQCFLRALGGVTGDPTKVPHAQNDLAGFVRHGYHPPLPHWTPPLSYSALGSATPDQQTVMNVSAGHN